MSERASAVSRATGTVDPLIGRVINDRFKITALIARGGMGKVYRGEQAPLGRVCAIKVLSPSYSGEHDPEFHKRFFLEASICSKLTHPNTVTIFDYGRTEDDIYYTAMEYLEGVTLHRAIRDMGYFPEERASHIARQICRALREAHSLGVIHRDLKPANVFLVEHGDEPDFVKVLDYGLVKNVTEGKGEDLTQTGLFMGSPKYMAPEQIKGDKVDARTDIYALGVMIYEMVTGKVPFDRASSVNILMAHVHDIPPRLHETNPAAEASPAFQEVIFRCLAKSPDDRYASMDEVLQALKRTSGTGFTSTYAGLVGEDVRSVHSGSGPSSLRPAPSVKSGAVAHSAITQDSGAVTRASGDVSPSQPPPASASKGLYVMGGVTVAMAAAALFVALRKDHAAPAIAGPAVPASATARGPEPSERSEREAGPVVVSASAAAASSARPSVQRLRIVTEPDGAQVREGGMERCASTPCEIPYEGSEAELTRERKISVSKAGYKVEERVVRPVDGAVVIRLTKTTQLPVGPRPTAPPKPTGVEPAPSGFRGID